MSTLRDPYLLRTAHLIAKVSDTGKVLSVGTYSAPPEGLTVTGRDCNYMQLFAITAPTYAAAAKTLSEMYPRTHRELSKRFPSCRRGP